MLLAAYLLLCKRKEQSITLLRSTTAPAQIQIIHAEVSPASCGLKSKMKRAAEPPAVASRRRRRSARQSRRRLLQNGPTTNHDICGELSMLPPDVCVRVLELVSIDDLAEFSCVSKHCRALTLNPVLPQDRWGTLTIPRNKPVATILSVLSEAQKRGRFDRINGLQIRYLELGGMETATHSEVQHLLRSILLPTITRLRLSAPRLTCGRFVDVPNCISAFLSKIMPNLRDVKLEISSNRHAINNFAKNCPLLESFVWSYQRNITLKLDLCEFKRSRNLKTLELDYTRFDAKVDDRLHPDRIQFLHHVRDTVERVSIRCATAWFYDPDDDDETPEELIPDQVLVQFVRNAPRLQWFRSDLCDRCVAKLKTERPEITFEF